MAEKGQKAPIWGEWGNFSDKNRTVMSLAYFISRFPFHSVGRETPVKHLSAQLHEGLMFTFSNIPFLKNSLSRERKNVS